jgi:adenylate kinase family enzyme
MQRIIVLGPPGSGKSTLARQLGALLSLPVFHLDQAFWQPGWVEAPSAVFQAEVERLSALPSWIIEGNYTATLAPRIAAADTVIYLDVPAPVATARVIRRMLVNFGHVRLDAAPGCPERLDLAFLRFVWSWNRVRRVRSLDVVARFPGRRIVLRTQADRSRLLAITP